jgi:nucleotide sugar dehydrogenase
MRSKSDSFKQISLPVFFGLSHLGQVFSLCWSKKIGNCYVYDNDNRLLNSFKEKKYTLEEPKLNKLKLNKIKFLKKFEEIRNFKYIFFTHDTPLKLKNGKPELNLIYKNLKKIFSLKFQTKTYLIISSQINPELMKNLKKKIKIDKNIKIFYLVDTLKMGESLDKFLNPSQIIIGGEKREKKNILKLFKKFKSKKFYISLDEAIITKMAINIYLSFSVTFANIIDDLCRQYGSNYSKIIEPLKNDKRIGHDSYINPSLGFSGGHLERDLFYLNEISKNKIIKKIIKNILNFNDKVINKINDKNLSKKKIIKTLVVGKSYKKNSFSIVNSPFNKLNKNFKLNYFDDIFFKYNNSNKKLEELVKKTDLIIYNYSSKKTVDKILNLSKKLNKKIINISEKKINFKNNRNFINFHNNY